ncbi:M48 family metalloprotease [Halorientalis halophila]|uniref:M48 family metalloprotease n=1 Tax=Halorientalis halophila TaxID=3108499 RepID=UPI00300B2606
MRHPGLKVRMAVSGVVLFAFYAGLVTVLEPLADLPILVGLTLLFVAGQYKFGKWMAVRSVGGEEFPREEYPEIAAEFDRLCAEMGVEDTKLLIGQMGVPNAFAVGRKGAGVVVVSDTLLELLETDELAGVLAHELAHVKNRDSIVMLLGQSVATLVSMFVFFVIALADDSIVGSLIGWVLSIIVNAVVMIFVLAISRYREYVADDDAAAYTDDPEALARALVKINEVGHHEQAPDVDDRVGALCIFGGKRGLLSILFATHPPMEKRVAKLAPQLLG